MTNYSPEYLRRRRLVRWIFWTPITLAALAICAVSLLAF